jgi:hypothetical protein
MALMLVAACDSGSKPEGDKGGDSKEAAGDDKGGDTKPAADKPAEAAETKIEQLGLKAELPAGSQVTDGIGGKGVMIIGTAPVTIDVAGDDKPKTLDAAKKDAETYTPTNFKEEKLDDGWILTFENTGSMGTNYWLTSRREIGDKGYACNTSVNSAEQRDAAIKICKSLKN